VKLARLGGSIEYVAILELSVINNLIYATIACLIRGLERHGILEKALGDGFAR
jgi:hypothetical protein